MSRIRIDFARRRAIPSTGLVALAALTLALAAGAYRYAMLDETMRQLSHEADDTNEHRAQLNAVQPTAQAAIAPERRQAITAAISELNVRWPALLDALEHSKPADAVVLQIEPRTKDKALLVTAQAPAAGALVDFMDALAASAPFFKATPVAQEPVDEGAPALQGSFMAFWNDGQDGLEAPKP